MKIRCRAWRARKAVSKKGRGLWTRGGAYGGGARRWPGPGERERRYGAGRGTGSKSKSGSKLWLRNRAGDRERGGAGRGVEKVHDRERGGLGTGPRKQSRFEPGERGDTKRSGPEARCRCEIGGSSRPGENRWDAAQVRNKRPGAGQVQSRTQGWRTVAGREEEMEPNQEQGRGQERR